MARGNRRTRRRIAESYAQALYELASDKGRLDRIREELGELKTVLEQNVKLEQLFSSPIVKPELRRRIIDQLAGEFDPVILGLLEVMNRRGRLGLLRGLVEAFLAEDDRRQGKIPVSLTTAEEVDQTLMEEIDDALSQFLAKKPIITHRIRPEILGGFIAQAGDLLIDASVRSQLSRVRDSLLVRGEDEIQSGRDYIGNQA